MSVFFGVGAEETRKAGEGRIAGFKQTERFGKKESERGKKN